MKLTSVLAGLFLLFAAVLQDAPWSMYALAVLFIFGPLFVEDDL